MILLIGTYQQLETTMNARVLKHAAVDQSDLMLFKLHNDSIKRMSNSNLSSDRAWYLLSFKNNKIEYRVYKIVTHGGAIRCILCR